MRVDRLGVSTSKKRKEVTKKKKTVQFQPQPATFERPMGGINTVVATTTAATKNNDDECESGGTTTTANNQLP